MWNRCFCIILQGKHPNWSRADANAAAWQQGKRLLAKAIAQRLDFAFETTLGGNSMLALLSHAAVSGIAVHVWYVGLATPELHIQRVQARVRTGGHDIAESDIRRRYRTSLPAQLDLPASEAGCSAPL